MAQQGGFGVLLKINTGSLTSIVGVVETEFPEQEKLVDEIWTHDGTSGYPVRIASGARNLHPFTATVLWDDLAATNAALLTNLNADTPVGCSIQDPDGQEIIAFSAHVSKIKRIAKTDEAYKAEIEISPTGAPTIT